VTELREILQGGSVLLDGAMGTALLALGLRGRAPAWNLSHPREVLGVHRAHVEAGAQIALTNTFAGASEEEAAAATRLARESGAQFVAGSLWAGLHDLGRQIAQLAAADAIWLESATSAAQALSALRVAKDVTALPIVVTCAMPAAPLDELSREGAVAAGHNCTPWPARAGARLLKPDAGGLAPEPWARKVLELGGSLLGGCCGTTADHLRALQRLRATAR